MSFSQDDPATCVASDGCQRAALPLCVDLDGTLISSNLLWECTISLLKHNPVRLLLAPFWLLRGGRPNLKRQFAQSAPLEFEEIPYNRELLEFLRTERERGRQIVLATAADQQLAERIAKHTAVFEHVYGTRDGENLKGRTKADFLCAKFGTRGFEYVGNSQRLLMWWAPKRSPTGLLRSPKYGGGFRARKEFSSAGPVPFASITGVRTC
jgi:hypothetical protein